MRKGVMSCKVTPDGAFSEEFCHFRKILSAGAAKTIALRRLSP